MHLQQQYEALFLIWHLQIHFANSSSEDSFTRRLKINNMHWGEKRITRDHKRHQYKGRINEPVQLSTVVDKVIFQ